MKIRKVFYAIAAAIIILCPGAARAEWVADTIQTGANPIALAVNPITGTAYVANAGGNSITVIDCRTHKVKATIPVDSNPTALAVNPITNRIYVANQGGNTVTVIEGDSHRTATIPVGIGPSAIAINGSTNRIYVANKAGHTVTRISGETNETLSIPVGKNPKAIAVNPVTDLIYVADSGSNAVTVIDGMTGDTANIAAGNGPGAVCINPATNTIYAANALDGTVTAIDGATRAVSTIVVGANPVAMAANPATNKVYVVNQSNLSITVIDGGTNAATNVFVGNNPVSVAVNPATNRIYVANNLGKSLTIINGATNAKQTLTVQGSPLAIAVNTLMNRIYVTHAGGGVSAVDGTANDTVRVALDYRSYGTPAINPITNKIYVTTDGGVTEIDGETNAETNLLYSDSVSCVAVNPVTNKVYASLDNGYVAIIDRSTGARTTLNVEEGLFRVSPGALAINCVTNKIYVTDRIGEYVAVIDGATNTWKRVKTFGGQPDAIAVNPVTNKIYVANWGNVAVIDGASDEATSIGVYSNGSGIAVNPVTNRIYVPMYKSDSVAVIDGETETWTLVPADSMPYAIAVNPVTNMIYAANYRGKTVTAIDGATNKTTRIPVGLGSPDGIAINPVNNRIYVVSQSTASIDVIDGATNKLTRIVAGAFSGGIAANPVTGRIYKPNASSSGSSKFVSLMIEAPSSDTKLRTVIDIPFDHFSYSARPVLSGKGVNRLRPGRSGIVGIGTGTGTIPNPWSWASPTSGAGTDSVNWQWKWGADSLVFGENYLCAIAVDSQASTGNLGPGTSHVGNLTVFPVYRLQKPPVSAPNPLSPPDSATENAGQGVFSWSAVPDAEYYVLQFSKYSNFQPVSYSRRIYGTSQTVSLEAGSTGNVAYYWRVNAANTGGAAAWSKARKYTLDAPAKPNLYSPGWASQNQPLSVTIAWRSVKSSVRYHLEITPTRQDDPSWPTGTPLLFGDSLFTDTVKVLSGLTAGTPYSIRVRATNAGGAVSQWAVGLFFTAAVTGAIFDPSLPREFSLAQSSRAIRYALPAPSRVSLKIFDLKGRLAATLVDAMQDPGYYSVVVRDIPISHGTYITEFKAGQFSKRGLLWISGE